MALITWKDIFERKMILISLASLYELPKFRFVPAKRTISYADDDDDDDSDKEGNSLKIRSGRRWRNKVSRGKFEGVYSRVGFIPPCILYISGGSFRSGSCSGENQEITEKDEREAQRGMKRERERKGETRARNQILSFSERRSGASGSKFRGELSWNWFLFITRSLAYVVDLINGIAESEARTDSLSSRAKGFSLMIRGLALSPSRSRSSRARVASSSSPCTATNATDRR